MSRWTPELRAFITEKWLAGCSAATIAGMLPFDVSRNAIIGVVHRMGLVRSDEAKKAANRGSLNKFGKKLVRAKREAAVKKPAQIKRTVDIATIPSDQPLPPLVRLDRRLWVSLPGCEPKTLIDLPSNGCKWPVDAVHNTVEEAPIAMFCAAVRCDDSSYCRVHRSWSVSKKPLAPLRFGRAA